jgi:hypothetical protein
MPFEHVPHPHIAYRKKHGPPTVQQAIEEHPSFNLRLAARGTRLFSSMPAFYIFVIYGALGAVFVSAQVTLLYWSNWAQLWSLPLLAVGSAVLGVGLNKMMKRQFDDVEAILHSQDQVAAHLAAQDEKILAILAELAANTTLTQQARDLLDGLTGSTPATDTLVTRSDKEGTT